MLIRPMQQSDSAVWERMRRTLWPSAAGEHAHETDMFFNVDRSRPAEVFVAFDDSGEAVGFAELAIRPYAEGCYSGRVAYLEDWFVEATARGNGIGGALARAAEDWGRAQGCSELASDTEIANAASASAHEALGFVEFERIICFRKAL